MLLIARGDAGRCERIGKAHTSAGFAGAKGSIHFCAAVLTNGRCFFDVLCAIVAFLVRQTLGYEAKQPNKWGQGDENPGLHLGNSRQMRRVI